MINTNDNLNCLTRYAFISAIKIVNLQNKLTDITETITPSNS